jgi:flagellar biosynthesis/type III secretory pathway protein FliH
MQEAFTYLGQEEKVRVRLNSLDISSAEQAETLWKPVAGSLKDVELVIDNSIEAGGCLLESEKGSSVDMRLQTIFTHIEEAVKKLYSSSEG